MRAELRAFFAELASAARLRVPVSPDEIIRIERGVSFARLVVAATTLLVVWIDAHGGLASQPSLVGLLGFYLFYSAVAVARLQRRREVTPAFLLTGHSIDLVATSTITLMTSGPSSPLFFVFIFVLLAAAFRWGFWETLTTALIVITVLMVEAVLLSMSGPNTLLATSFSFNDLVVRTGYVSIIGLLLGYLAEETKQLRAETAAVADLQSKMRVDQGLTKTLQTLGDEIIHVFRASELVLAVEDAVNGRLFRWDSRGGWATDPDRLTGDLASSERAIYWFGTPGQSLFAFRRSARKGYGYLVMDSAGRLVDSNTWKVPPEFIAAHKFRRLICVPMEFSNEWQVRVFLLDPSVDLRPETLLRFVQLMTRQVAPSLLNVYLLGRLRARAGAIERARIARELHDGVIQSLIAAELELTAVRRKLNDHARPLEPDLERIQDNLHKEVLNVRELLEQMRPLELRPADLPEYLADLVSRFERDTGIAARFTTDLADIALPPRVCHELVRIVQEALVNVRKHGAAQNVMVRLAARDGRIRLEIDDDGRGFAFEGLLTHGELDALRRGPRVIKERVRAIGGELTVDSAPGRGATLRITVPQEAHG